MTSTRTRPRGSGQVVASTGLDHELTVYGEIGWDVVASQFVADLKQAQGGPVAVHLNSPGGDLFEGLGIYEALRSHPGRVTVYVDALAASAASVIAMASDDLVMAPGAMLMLHDALTMTYGNEADHLKTAELLGQSSDVIAGIYAARAGGTAAEWRKVMRSETWYTAGEAVAAGLADRVRDVRPISNRARQARAQAPLSVDVAGQMVSALVCSALGARPAPRLRAGRRRPVPSAMPTIRQLRAVR
jgi:ATP-dependent protease ClpP protease subunit